MSAVGPRRLRLPNRELIFERPMVVGIVNTTPDSFFDGGRFGSSEEAVEVALSMEAQGADVIEIGGEKAGPGQPVSTEAELDRVLPVVRRLRERSAIPISVDTRNPGVAKKVLDAGADIINDINGLRGQEMRNVVSSSAAGVIVMHIQGKPRVPNPNPSYGSVVGDISEFFQRQVEILVDGGIAPDRIALDPGPDFGKSTSHNLQLLAGWESFRQFDQPVMLAVSRKRFIGEVLGVKEPSERLVGSLAITAFVLGRGGCDLIRTHDVLETRQVVDILLPLM